MKQKKKKSCTRTMESQEVIVDELHSKAEVQETTIVEKQHQQQRSHQQPRSTAQTKARYINNARGRGRDLSICSSNTYYFSRGTICLFIKQMLFFQEAFFVYQTHISLEHIIFFQEPLFSHRTDINFPGSLI